MRYYRKLLGLIENSLYKIDNGKFLNEDEIHVFGELWKLKELGNIDERQLVIHPEKNKTKSHTENNGTQIAK